MAEPQVPWQILAAVRLLHERGYHQLRVLPGISRTGLFWQVSVSTADNVTGGFDWWRPRAESRVLRYTTAQATQLAGREVASDAPSDTVAALILSTLPGTEPRADDPEYLRWFAELLALAERHGRLPIAYDEDLPPGAGWALCGRLEVHYPEPPDAPHGRGIERATTL